MQFTRLRLNGFKSFVDPTDLVISAGLTGVVGPNGCGKSNLLEALRWIMGENRPTQMRGEGMDDVIFAGSESRPARNAAAVELVIDNSDRLAPAAFNKDDRLEVSRRITREIGSAYRLNGREVRARDVQMLFADASSGAHSPALVRQGQIAELISAKPKARRRVLEEAAGISGLYQRRHEAELKLRATEANLARIDDLLGELSQRLASLERQAGQARRYRAIAEGLRRAEAVALWLRWRAAEDERVAAETEATAALRAVAAAEAAVRAATRAREQAAAALPPRREEEAVAAAIHQRLAVERERLDEQEKRARAEIESLAARTRQLAADLEREETLGRDAHATLDRLAADEARLTAAMQGQDEAQAAAAEAARVAADRLTAEEQALDKLTGDAARLAAQAGAAERRLNETRDARDRLDAAIAAAEQAQAGFAEQIVAAEAGLASRRGAAEAAGAASDAAEQALAEAAAGQAGAREAEAAARSALAEAEGETAALSAEARGAGKAARPRRRRRQPAGRPGRGHDGLEAALGAALGDDLSRRRGGGRLGLDRARSLRQRRRRCRRARVRWRRDRTRPGAARPALVADGHRRRRGRRRAAGRAGPGQRLVSAEGDLWRWDGLRLRAGEAPNAAALRLVQRNRLAGLQASPETTGAARDERAAAHAAARAALDAAGAREAAARRARREAETAQAEAGRALGQAERGADDAALATGQPGRDAGRAPGRARRRRRRSRRGRGAAGRPARSRRGAPGGRPQAAEVDAARQRDARGARPGRRPAPRRGRPRAPARPRSAARPPSGATGATAPARASPTSNAASTRRASARRRSPTSRPHWPSAAAASSPTLEAAEARRRAAADALAQAETALREAETRRARGRAACLCPARGARAPGCRARKGSPRRAEAAADEIRDRARHRRRTALRARLDGDLPPTARGRGRGGEAAPTAGRARPGQPARR